MMQIDYKKNLIQYIMLLFFSSDNSTLLPDPFTPLFHIRSFMNCPKKVGAERGTEYEVSEAITLVSTSVSLRIGTI